MKGVIDEIIGGSKIPIVNEDYIWSSIENIEEEEQSDESQYEGWVISLDLHNYAMNIMWRNHIY